MDYPRANPISPVDLTVVCLVVAHPRLESPAIAYFFALADDFAGASAAVGPAFGWSPRTVLRGQTLKAGHFSQPATMAIGQSVMG